MIRATKKDRLPEHAKVQLVAPQDATADAKRTGATVAAELASVVGAVAVKETAHPSWVVKAETGKAFDFSELALGTTSATRKMPYIGRPELLAEIFPTLLSKCAVASELTVRGYLHNLRIWWRLFEEVESRHRSSEPLRSLAQLSEVHHVQALDSGMHQPAFSAGVRLFEPAREGLGLPALNWASPKRKRKLKHLPEERKIKAVRHALRAHYTQFVDRVNAARQLTALTDEQVKEQLERGEMTKVQQRVRSNLLAFGRDCAGQALPKDGGELFLPENNRVTAKGEAYRRKRSYTAKNNSPVMGHIGYGDICDLLYPTAFTVRAAFHLMLSRTPFNISVLTSMDVNDEHFRTHPLDDARYVMVGYKGRSGQMLHDVSGLRKSLSGPLGIYNFITSLNAPLREQLQRKHDDLVEVMKAHALDNEQYAAHEQTLITLRQGLASPWLYVTALHAGGPTGDGIDWLTDDNYDQGGDSGTFLKIVINALNKSNKEAARIPSMSLSDFRDAYAISELHSSGGNLYRVMRALGHRFLSTTGDYVQNVHQRQHNQDKARLLMSTWFGEVKLDGEVDPSVTAAKANHALEGKAGDLPQEQRQRLEQYRMLKRTRIGVACENPTAPPKHVAPHFEADGVKLCDVQRCTLCVEYAVVLPDSIDGLCRRVAELEWMHTEMPVVAWQSGSYGLELHNTRAALTVFVSEEVDRRTHYWHEQIASGAWLVTALQSS